MSHSPQNAQGESSAKKRENVSLWKRARETFGTQNLTFLSNSPSPPARGTSSGPTASTKRREQVRKAQRTHRVRTQNYIKALETEVVRLRETDGQQRRQLKDNCDCFKSFREYFIHHNIALPSYFGSYISDLERGVFVSESRVIVAQIRDSFGNARLKIDWSETDTYVSDSVTHSPPSCALEIGHKHQPSISTHSAGSISDTSVLKAHTPNFSRQNRSPSKPPVLVTTIDTIYSAIEFVLALEHPCMYHTQHPGSIYNSAEPGNHMMTASTALIARAPLDPKEDETLSWKESAVVIKRLLSMSFVVQRQGELTPIQAWQRIVNHPRLSALTPTLLQSLIINLTPEMDCQGFGAVMDEEFFERSLEHHLAISQELDNLSL